MSVAAVVMVMASRARAVMVMVATGETSRTLGAGAMAVVKNTAVAMNPEIMKVAVEAKAA